MNQTNTHILQEPSTDHSCVDCGKSFPCEGYPECYDQRGHRKFCSACREIKLEAKRREQLLENAGIPTKFRTIETDRKDFLEEAVKSKRGLFLHGSEGTGKTVFMCSLLKRLSLEKGMECRFVSSIGMVMRLQDSFRLDIGKVVHGDTALDLMNDLAKVQCLYIDDMGTEKLTDFVKQAFYYVINEREQNNLKTLITSNYSLKKLNDLFTARISSRIAGSCDVIQFTGEDRRIKREMNAA